MALTCATHNATRGPSVLTSTHQRNKNAHRMGIHSQKHRLGLHRIHATSMAHSSSLPQTLQPRQHCWRLTPINHHHSPQGRALSTPNSHLSEAAFHDQRMLLERRRRKHTEHSPCASCIGPCSLPRIPAASHLARACRWCLMSTWPEWRSSSSEQAMRLLISSSSMSPPSSVSSSWSASRIESYTSHTQATSHGQHTKSAVKLERCR